MYQLEANNLHQVGTSSLLIYMMHSHTYIKNLTCWEDTAMVCYIVLHLHLHKEERKIQWAPQLLQLVAWPRLRNGYIPNKSAMYQLSYPALYQLCCYHVLLNGAEYRKATNLQVSGISVLFKSTSCCQTWREYTKSGAQYPVGYGKSLKFYRNGHYQCIF